MIAPMKEKESFYTGLVYPKTSTLNICQGPGFMKPPRQIRPVVFLHLPSLDKTLGPGGAKTAARE